MNCAWPPSRCGAATMRRATRSPAAAPKSLRIDVQAEVDAGAEPGRGHHLAFVDVERVGVDLDRREARAPAPRPRPSGSSPGGRRAGRRGRGRRRRCRPRSRGRRGAPAARSASSAALGRRVEDGRVAGDDDRVGVGAARSRPACGADPEAGRRAHLGARPSEQVENSYSGSPPRPWPPSAKACAGAVRSKATSPSRQRATTRCMAEIYRTLAFLPLDASAPRPRKIRAMQIAILIFDKLTALDAIGPYEVLRSSPAGRSSSSAAQKGEVRTEAARLGLSADHALDEVDRARHRPRPRRRRQPAAARGRGGALLAARGRRARPNGRPRSAPARWCSAPPACSRASGRPATGSTSSRCASTAPTRSAAASSRTARSITAAGVSAGIDMALHLVGRRPAPRSPRRSSSGSSTTPQPALRRRLAGEGAAGDRRAGHRRRRRERRPARRATRPAGTSSSSARAPRRPSAGCGPRASRPAGRRSGGWPGGPTGR